MSRWMGIVLVLLGSTSLAQAQFSIHSKQDFVFVLSPGSIEVNPVGSTRRNFFFAYDQLTGQAEPVCNALAIKLATASPVVNINSLSFGLDQVDYAHPHGDLAFVPGKSRLHSQNGPGPGISNGGTAGDLSKESILDYLADVYVSDNLVDVTRIRGTNRKASEENDAAKAKFGSAQFPNGSTVGLTGGATGTPIDTSNPSEIRGFDYHSPLDVLGNNAKKVYFTLDGSWQGFHPHQVLQYDYATNAITIFRDLASVEYPLLQSGDIIDAISLDLVHGPAINQEPSVIFSLARGSTSLSTVLTIPLTPADLFQSPKPTAHSGGFGTVLADSIYRRSYSAALDPRDGLIGGIVSIDPLYLIRYFGRVMANQPVLTAILRPLDEMVIVDQGEVKFWPGDVQPTLHNPLLPGERRVLEVWGDIGGVATSAGELVLENEFLNQPENPATGIMGIPNLTGGINWTWSNSYMLAMGDKYFAGLEGEPLVQVSGSAPYGVSTSNLPPGQHVFIVQFERGADGAKSAYHFGTAVMDTSVPTPEIDAFEVDASSQLILTLSNIGGLVQVEVTLGGEPPTYHPVSASETTLNLGTLLEWGPQEVEVVGWTATDRSFAVEATTYFARPTPGSVVDSTSVAPFVGNPTGVAVIERIHSTDILVVGSSGAKWFDKDLNPLIGAPTVNFGTGMVPLGVTTDHNSLFWTVENSTTGEALLFKTPIDGPYNSSSPSVSITGYSSVFGAGDLCLLPSGELVLADHYAELFGYPTQYRVIGENGDPLTASVFAGGKLRGVTTNPWGQASASIAHLERNSESFLLLPLEGATGTVEIAEVHVNGTVERAIPVESGVGQLTAMAYRPDNSSEPTKNIPLIFATSSNGTLYSLAAPRGLPSERDRHRAAFDPSVFELGSGTVPPSTDTGDASTTMWTVNVSEAATIGDLDVYVELAHSNFEKLEVALISPEGARVTLHAYSRMDKTIDEVNFRYDDLYQGGPDDRSGNRKPGESLSTFDGQLTNGNWTLEIINYGAQGYLNRAAISVAPEVAASGILPGDVDGNGSVELADFDWLYLFLQGGAPAFMCVEAYDVDGDGNCDLNDGVLLATAITGGWQLPCRSESLSDPFGCYQPNCP